MSAICSVCLDFFRDGNSAMVIGCGHVFHQACIHEWFRRIRSCPTCRFPVTYDSAPKLVFDFAHTTPITEQCVQCIGEIAQLRNESHALHDQRALRLDEIARLEIRNGRLNSELEQSKKSAAAAEQSAAAEIAQLRIQLATEAAKYAQSERRNIELQRQSETVAQLRTQLVDLQRQMANSNNQSAQAAARSNPVAMFRNQRPITNGNPIQPVANGNMNPINATAAARPTMINNRRTIAPAQQPTANSNGGPNPGNSTMGQNRQRRPGARSTNVHTKGPAGRPEWKK